ncbi:MbtH family protein [Streptomyces sp. NPDC088197]|uniref:MbtH family protein n=1 Tax=unclassified Streptomyces TaxID=2593676 RepID=UPI0033A3F09D
MTDSPFDDQDGTFHVLLNEQGRYSLWPAFAEIPDGWSAVVRSARRQECTAYIAAHWTDMGHLPAG